MGELEDAYYFGDDLKTSIDVDAIAKRVTNDNIKAAAKHFFDPKVYVLGVMRPKKTTGDRRERRECLHARHELVDVLPTLLDAVGLLAGGAAVGRGLREQRDERRLVAGSGEPVAVAIEVELEQAQRAELGVERAALDGGVKVAAWLAPGRADVDEQRRVIARRDRDLAGDEFGDRARGRRREELDVTGRAGRRLRGRGPGGWRRRVVARARDDRESARECGRNPTCIQTAS